MKKILPLFAALTLLAFPSANAAIVFGNLGAGGSGSLDTASQQISATTWLAQGFTTPATGDLLNLNSIVLGLSVNTGTTDAQVQLFADIGGQPGGAALFTLINTVVGDTPTLYTFTLNSPYLLSNGTTYWIVASDPDPVDQFNWVFNNDEVKPTAYNSSGYLWPASGTLRTGNSGDDWADRSANTQSFTAFYLNVTDAPGPEPIPEPGTWAAAALLVGGAAFMRWRRRQTA